MISYLRCLLVFLITPFILEAKVYDCFPFFNEIELLTMRFDELNDSVDYFVLVESVETQRGDPKPLYFKENRHLFKKYLPKVIHVIVDERHPEMGLWEREHFQRNCILRGLKDCESSDVIIISDLDEIPRKSTIDQLAALLSAAKAVSVAEAPPLDTFKKKWDYQRKHARLGAYALQMDNYYYQINRQTPTGKTWEGGLWYGTVVTTYAKLKDRDPQYFRNKRNKLPRIHKGGWHFTWMGGKEKVRQKLSSVVEGRSDGHLVTDAEIEEMLAKHPPVPIDDTFPAYVLRNIDYLKSIDFIAEAQ